MWISIRGYVKDLGLLGVGLVTGGLASVAALAAEQLGAETKLPPHVWGAAAVLFLLFGPVIAYHKLRKKLEVLEGEIASRHWREDRVIDDLNQANLSIDGVNRLRLFVGAFMAKSRCPDPLSVPHLAFYCFGNPASEPAIERAMTLRDELVALGLLEPSAPGRTTSEILRLQEPDKFPWWKRTKLSASVILRIKEREAMPDGPLKLKHFDDVLYAGVDPSTQK